MAKSKPFGRPTAYRASFKKLAFRYALLGGTDQQIAEFLGVCEATLNNWKNQHPDFLESLKDGKQQADAVVAEQLFKRATGYSHPDVHIGLFEGEAVVTKITKHYPPDVVAAIFWLKNRQPDTWRDVKRVHHDGGLEVQVENMSAVQIRAQLIADGYMDVNGRLLLEKN